MGWLDKTGHELRSLLDRGELTSEELTRDYLERVESVDRDINAFITGGRWAEFNEEFIRSVPQQFINVVCGDNGEFAFAVI